MDQTVEGMQQKVTDLSEISFHTDPVPLDDIPLGHESCHVSSIAVAWR
jgi:hypothetical protein